MAAPQSSPLPEAPTRGEAEGQFVPKANAFVGALEPFRQQLQRQADFVNERTSQLEQAATRAENAESGALDAEATSAANANFAGNWSSLSGSYSVPTSVFHEGYFWALVQNVSSIGDHEPGESSAWVIIQRAFRELSVEPTLSSNFRTGEHKLYGVQDGYKSRDLADIWDVTRASGETVLTPAGRIATVDPDTLPLTYVPETGGLGAQVTGAVTNLFLWSEDFTQSSWTKENVAIDGSSTPSPIDGVNCSRIEATTSGSETRRLSQSVSVESGNFYTITAYAKADETSHLMVQLGGEFRQDGSVTGVRIVFNLNTGSAESFFDSEANIVAMEAIATVGGGYKIRVTVECFNSSSSSTIHFVLKGGSSSGLASSLDAGQGVFFMGAQVVQSFALMPYVKTEGSTVTKPATSVVRELGDELNREELTVLVEWDNSAAELAESSFTPNYNVFAFKDISNTNLTGFGIECGSPGLGPQLTVWLRDGSNNHHNVSLGNCVIGRNRAAFFLHLREGLIGGSLNGSAVMTANIAPDADVSSVIESLRLVDGSLISGNSDRIVRALFYHYIDIVPRALPDAELIEWTRG